MFLSVLAILIHATLSVDPTTLDPSILAGITFDEETQQTFSTAITYNIGWVKVFYCNQGSGYDTTGDFSKKYIGSTSSSDSSRFAELAPYAISFKIVPDPDTNPTDDEVDDYAFYGKPCRDGVVALNNFQELPTSATSLDYYATNTALSRLSASCRPAYRSLDAVVYHACGNSNGVHLGNGGTHDTCFFGGTDRYAPTGKLAMYLGFDASKTNVCDGSGTIGSFYELDHCADVTCADTGNLCTQNVCIYGECVIQNKVAGTSCSDNDECNGDEACDGNGSCQAGIAIDCNDGNQCTEDICDETTHLCTNTPLGDASCDDGDLCTIDDVCDASGSTPVCVGEPKDCGFGFVCDGSTGDCVADCDLFDIDEYDEGCSAITKGGLDARVEALEEMITADSNAASPPIVDSNLGNKDALIILSLAMNILLLMILLCCYMKNGAKTDKYEKVKVYSAEVEDLKPIDGLDINA